MVGIGASEALAQADSLATVYPSGYVGVGGGAAFVDGDTDYEFTGSAVYLLGVGPVEVWYEYEQDVPAGPVTSADAWNKLGVAWRGDAYGGSVVAVRQGLVDESPETGIEVAGLLPFGEEPWSNMIRVVVTQTNETNGRVGFFTSW